MIQANELRIGNWIEKFTVLGDSLGFCKVEAKDFLAMSNHPEWQNPIPLTEEILLKCGFVRTVSKMKLAPDYIDYRKEQFVLFLLSSGKVEVEFCAAHNSIEERGYLTFVIHLHQLQNLYFALTGKELEVKLCQ